MTDENPNLPASTEQDENTAQDWTEEHTVDGAPDFSHFDDTMKDANGQTARDRAHDRYDRHLEQPE